MKKKTLADFIEYGKHELVAFVNGNQLLTKGDGNNLGESNLGVICYNKEKFFDEEFNKKPDSVQFIYKKESIHKQDSNIMIADFRLDQAEVISEVPLGIRTNYFNNFHLRKRTDLYKKAKNLLTKHGL